MFLLQVFVVQLSYLQPEWPYIIPKAFVKKIKKFVPLYIKRT